AAIACLWARPPRSQFAAPTYQCAASIASAFSRAHARYWQPSRPPAISFAPLRRAEIGARMDVIIRRRLGSTWHRTAPPDPGGGASRVSAHGVSHVALMSERVLIGMPISKGGVHCFDQFRPVVHV